MTFCLGMIVEEGLVGIADTRVTSGSECITAKKVTIHQVGDHSFFLMTSGLRRCATRSSPTSRKNSNRKGKSINGSTAP